MLSIGLLTQLFAVSSAWTRARDERMPGELRVVNEGLSHDDEYWYMTNKHFIYQVTRQPLTIKQANHNAIPEELRDQGYNHIGDIEVLDGVLYGGMENGPTGMLGRWNTSNLEIIDYTSIAEQKGVPWVTVNPLDRKLYCSEWNNVNTINVYDIDKQFEHVGVVSIANPDEYPKEVQGASFYNGDLYLATNVKDGIFKLDISTGVVNWEFNDDGNYVIDDYYYEMEGLTFWDLSELGLGTMHMYGNFMNAREKALHNFDV